jgi:hypothetical protein
MPVCNVVRFIPPPYNDGTGRFPHFQPGVYWLADEASERAATVVATEAAKQDQPSLL